MKGGQHEQIQSGLTAEIVKDYVASLLPIGWRLCHGPSVLPDFHSDSGAVIALGAEHSTGLQAGIKFPVPAFIEPLTLAAELGNALRIACVDKLNKSMTPTGIRFALEQGAKQPTRASEGASGYDLHTPIGHRLEPGRVLVIHTGVRIELPAGFEGQIRPRSSMSKRGLWVALGTIDGDYRGVIGATVINLNREAQDIAAGDRIAQLVIARVEHLAWVQVEADALEPTVRGDGGFGSTGK